MFKIAIYNLDEPGAEPIMDEEYDALMLLASKYEKRDEDEGACTSVAYSGALGYAQPMARAFLKACLEPANRPMRAIYARIAAATSEKDYKEKIIVPMLQDLGEDLVDAIEEAEDEEN